MSIKEKPPDYYKSIKTSLKGIIKNPEINTKKINDAVLKSNKIVIHTLQFLKLYLLHHYELHSSLPPVNHLLINTTMKILCDVKEDKRGRPKKEATTHMYETLTAFYQEHYQPTTQPDKLDYTYLNNVLEYLTEDIQTMYENNIQLHYVDYVEGYVNVVWKQKYLMEKIRKLGKTKAERERRIYKLHKTLRSIKEDLLNVENKEYKSPSFYHLWITQQKQHILPTKEKFQKDHIAYDLKCSPMDYLPCMLYMMKQVEASGESIQNVFPLRSSILPHYIRLDTTTLVNLLMRKEQGNKGEYLTGGNLKKNEDKIWDFFFRTERKLFQKTNYLFHHMISTDGVGVSILFLRKDLVGKRVPTMKKKENAEQYVDELKDTTAYQSKKIVGIDPNKGDLIYCVDGCTKDSTTFRYSQDQRRKETKSKKYRNILLRMKHNKMQGKNIYEYETELSKFNRKTLHIDKYKEYLTAKNHYNYVVCSFYQRELFRKLKFNSYINAKRNEQKMINNFRKTFGNPEDVIICIGDWEQRKQMKFKEPTIGVGMRSLFRKNKYMVLLVDEFRTSCRCSKCEGGICEKFLPRINPKPKKEDIRLVHGLLRCKSGCGTWNRDRNSASNIYKISYNAIHNMARPSYLCREKQCIIPLHRVCNTQNVHRSARTKP
jgi:uncharacterized protein (UPF0248 family)